MLYRILLGLSLVFYTTVFLAQESTDQDMDRHYVTDQLRLSLYQEANSQSPVIKLLRSGDMLKVEQVSGPYALVTTAEELKGWVKRGFLVRSPTSNLLLREEQQKTEYLALEIEKLNNSKVVIDQYEKDMDELVEKIKSLESESQNANESITGLQQEVKAKQVEIDRKDVDSAPAFIVLWDTLRKYWEIIVPLIAVIMLFSFLVSKAIIEARIKSKFHGIKIW